MKALSIAGLLLALLGSPGCIHHRTTVYRDEARLPVTFENDRAGRLFYETLSRTGSPHRPQEGNTRVKIPVVFSYEETVRTGDNTRFNQAVRACDTNQDGNISETEARIFSEARH